MAITLAQAKSLQYGDLLHIHYKRNADGTSMRAKVNGKVKTWKTRPDNVRIPYKHGMYDYGYFSQSDLDILYLGFNCEKCK